MRQPPSEEARWGSQASARLDREIRPVWALKNRSAEVRWPVLQIVFNDISAAELSRLPTQIQFHLLEALNLQPGDIDEDILKSRYGLLERAGKKLYRCRAGDHRIYFAINDGHVRVHRVLHKNSLQDFLYRSNLPGGGEDEALSQSKSFWQLIDEGAKTLKVA